MNFDGQIITSFGGRKTVLGFAFLACTTYVIISAHKFAAQATLPVDYTGLALAITAIAAGLGTIVWGNVKEHQAKTPNEEKAAS